MARLLRPYIPYSVRALVLRRQLLASGATEADIVALYGFSGSHKTFVPNALKRLFGDEAAHLDHDPALENREKIFSKGIHVGYRPDANDPGFLLYREARAHYIKTHVSNGAQYSDTVLAKRERRRQKKYGKAQQTVIERSEVVHSRIGPKRKLQGRNQWPPKGSRKIIHRTTTER